jgi:hypothetical protein
VDAFEARVERTLDHAHNQQRGNAAISFEILSSSIDKSAHWH